MDKERIKRILNGKTSNDAVIRTQFYKRVLIRAMKEDFTDLVKKRSDDDDDDGGGGGDRNCW